MKVKCTKCQQEKTENDFHKDIRRTNKLRSWCKSCAYDNNREHIKNRGYVINKCNGIYIAYHNNKTLKKCKTRQAAQFIVDKAKLREAKRELEDKKLELDSYWLTL